MSTTKTTTKDNPAEVFAVFLYNYHGGILTLEEMDTLNTMIDYCDEAVNMDYQPPWSKNEPSKQRRNKQT